MLTSKELLLFMLGYAQSKDEDKEFLLQTIVKHKLMCERLGLAPMTLEEVRQIRIEVIATMGIASQAMLKENIWEKKQA